MSTFRTALLVAGKDLRVEWRSRIGLNQVLPFAAIVMVMFAFALDVQLAVLEALLLLTAMLLYGSELRWSGLALLVATWLTATVGLAAVGTLYGGLAAGARGRETLLPLLLLPVVAPVLIGATRAVEAALGTGGTAVADGWPWVGVVAVFAVAFGAGGTLAFGPLIDE